MWNSYFKNKRKLAAAYIFLICARALSYAQDEEPEELKALVEVSPNEIYENLSFTVTILVNHPRPGEIKLEMPDLKDEFYFEKLRTQSHIMNSGKDSRSRREKDDDTNKWTELSVVFVPLKAGSYIIDEFTISSPADVIMTLPLFITVLPAKDTLRVPKLKWAGAVPVRVGEQVQIFLAIIDWERGLPYPEDIIVPSYAVKNAIIENMPVTGTQVSEGIVRRLLIRPLGGKEISIEKKTVRYHEFYISVPELKIKILPAYEKIKAEETAPFTASDTGASASAKPRRFAAASLALFFEIKTGSAARAIDGGAFNECMAGAETAWAEGDYAYALSILRSGERDLVSGRDIAQLRKKLELTFSEELYDDENYAPRKILVSLLTLSFSCMIFFLAVYFYRKNKEKKTPFPVKRFCVTCAVCIFCITRSAEKTFGPKRAVLAETSFYSVPEHDKESSGRFGEGTPVRVRAIGAEWAFAESSGGAAGWVPKDKVFLY